MKNIKMFGIAVLTALAVFFVPAVSVLGYELPDPDKPVSLSMTLKYTDEEEHCASGAKITIYKVADFLPAGSSAQFVLNKDYVSSGLDIDGKITQSQIDDLQKYTEKNNITGLTGMTDKDGKIVFDGLVSGVYLVSATSLPDGFTSFVPFLYYLPYYDQDSGNWVCDGVAEPKISYVSPVTITVKKVWNDNNKNRPVSVTVQLVNDDGVYDTVTLNKDNDWRYEWNNMRSDKTWSVQEIDIPADYKATYSSSGYEFTITNTSQLVQTGQLQWPVPVMLFAGSFLICAGILIKVPGTRKDED